jgi:hypothetical protein
MHFPKTRFRPSGDETSLFSYIYRWRPVTSGRAPARKSFLTVPLIFRRPRSRETSFKGPWECKVTPAYSACQEGNTTGCILNNDGLGAGVADLFGIRFPQREFIVRSQRQWTGVSGQGPVKSLWAWLVVIGSAVPGWGCDQRGTVAEICVIDGPGVTEFLAGPESHPRARVRKCPRRFGEGLCEGRRGRIRPDSRPCGRSVAGLERRRR